MRNHLMIAAIVSALVSGAAYAQPPYSAPIYSSPPPPQDPILPGRQPSMPMYRTDPAPMDQEEEAVDRGRLTTPSYSPALEPRDSVATYDSPNNPGYVPPSYPPRDISMGQPEYIRPGTIDRPQTMDQRLSASRYYDPRVTNNQQFREQGYPAAAYAQPNVISGGVGQSNRAMMESVQKDYAVKLVFTGRDGIYLSNVNVTIEDSKGQQVLTTATDGPWLLAKLEPGRYKVLAETNGITQERTINVGKSLKTHQISFNIADEAPYALR